MQVRHYTLVHLSKCASPYCYSSQVVPRPLLESLAGCDAPNIVTITFGKPEIAVWSGCDPPGGGACWERKFGDGAAGADAVFVNDIGDQFSNHKGSNSLR